MNDFRTKKAPFYLNDLKFGFLFSHLLAPFNELFTSLPIRKHLVDDYMMFKYSLPNNLNRIVNKYNANNNI